MGAACVRFTPQGAPGVGEAPSGVEDLRNARGYLLRRLGPAAGERRAAGRRRLEGAALRAAERRQQGRRRRSVTGVPAVWHMDLLEAAVAPLELLVGLAARPRGALGARVRRAREDRRLRRRVARPAGGP